MTRIFSTLVLIASITCGLATAQDSDSIDVAEYSFSYKKPWIRQAVSSSMRVAELTYKQEKEDLENITVAFFLMGGSPKANLDRWKGQFDAGAKTEVKEKEVNGKKVTYFTGKGGFQDSMGGPFAPKVKKDNYAVLAAILPSESGRLVFLKLKGPAASVDAIEAAFYELTESALK